MLVPKHRFVAALVLGLLTAHAVGLARDCRAAGWVNTRQFPPFDVWTEFPLTEVQDLLAELAQLQQDLHRDLGVPGAGQWVAVHLFRDKYSYARYLRQHLAHVPYRRALYVKSQGQGRVYAYRSRELPTDLRHECTHALLHAVLPVVPLWLDEGLAEYYEMPAAKRSFDNPHLRTLRWNLIFGSAPQLESLEKLGDISEMKQAEYRNSWAWVHFMLHGPEAARQELVRYLWEIASGTPPAALSQRLEQRLPGTRQRLLAHLKGWKRESWLSAFR
ncbi:MAG: hypothetical protein JXB62_23200 [Pirellulales bacterium]|nr:hypothetical protein [Pirellulales bacterium]